MAEVRLEDAPTGVRSFYDKGIAAMERGNLDYAMDMFEAVLEIEPRLMDARKLLRAAALKKTKGNPPGKLAMAKATGTALKAATLIKKEPLRAMQLAETALRTAPANPRFAKVFCDAAEAAHPSRVATGYAGCLRSLNTGTKPPVSMPR